MYFQYGAYRHDAYEVGLIVSVKEPMIGSMGIPIGYRVVWQLTGELLSTSIAGVTEKIRQLETAYARTNVDCGLYTDAGGFTAHRIIAANTNFVRASGPVYPEFRGDYVTSRKYQITIEAEVIDRGLSGNLDLQEYAETIEVMGDGGPIESLAPVMSGPWPRQQIHTHSPVTIRQSGQAVGLNRYPIPSQPVYPQFLIRPGSPRLALTTPKSLSTRTGWGISWGYEMLIPGPVGVIAPRTI